jgi:hypothetical protein
VASADSFGTAESRLLVRNPVFTSTQNPPQMIMGDKIKIPTIIENLSDFSLKSITIEATSNDKLAIKGVSTDPQNIQLEKHSIVLEEILPHESKVIYWEIEATQVGDTNFTTVLRIQNPKFVETSQLQKPLYVSPPGYPHSTLFRSAMKSGDTWKQEIFMNGTEAFTLATLNFLAGLDFAVIEGVESMAEYPVSLIGFEVYFINGNLVWML